MSGLCGICEPGREMDSRLLEPMLSVLAVAEESVSDTTAGNSVSLGVARRWEFQQVAATTRVRVAIDADLYNIPELKARLAARGLDSGQWSLARCLEERPGAVRHANTSIMWTMPQVPGFASAVAHHVVPIVHVVAWSICRTRASARPAVPP